MTKTFSPLVQRAFDQWINMDTWHSGHACDDERFYVFVWAVVRRNRNRPDASAIQTQIKAAKEGKFEPDALDFHAKNFADLYNHLCDFAKARKLPGTPSRDVARYLASQH